MLVYVRAHKWSTFKFIFTSYHLSPRSNCPACMTSLLLSNSPHIFSYGTSNCLKKYIPLLPAFQPSFSPGSAAHLPQKRTAPWLRSLAHLRLKMVQTAMTQACKVILVVAALVFLVRGLTWLHRFYLPVWPTGEPSCSSSHFTFKVSFGGAVALDRPRGEELARRPLLGQSSYLNLRALTSTTDVFKFFGGSKTVTRGWSPPQTIVSPENDRF